MSVLLTAEIWWRGPDWLIKGEEHWPVTSYESKEGDERVIIELAKKTCLVASVVTMSKKENRVLDIENYSTTKKVIRVTAWIMQVVENCRKKSSATRNGELIQLVPNTFKPCYMHSLSCTGRSLRRRKRTTAEE